jgi:hypothetical protein
LVRDAGGDASVTNPDSGAQLVKAGNDPALDLLSADVAADRRSLTAVVRVAADMRTSTAVSGHSVELVFQAIGELRWNLNATFPLVGPMQVSLGQVEQGGTAVAGEGLLSPDGRTVRLTVPLSAFGSLAPRPLVQGDRVSHLWVYTNRALAVESSGVFSPAPADAASTARTYRVGSPSCIRP